ncbi:unnamed protein product [Fusarium equiseti]|uniref:Fungal N-terminal domain-containing protein n=1 Tax=Fusarium equiseti TaxID=61235 RepID=A0A8J2NJE5_FUSEQ|nr:unnamed protein product [Fusarium equiseti]
MDPLSITSASVAVAAAVYKTSVKVKRIVGVMNDATESLSDLSEEVQIVHAALQSVENALNEDKEAIQRYKVDEVFAIAVKGCRATLSCIEREFEVLFNRQDWKVKFMVLWKEDNMNKLLARLYRKWDSIMLLVQLLSLRSVKEIRTLVAEKKDSLTVAKDDITALMPTYWSCRDTILDSLDRATAESIYADMESRDSRISTTEFDFDFEILNTRTYRRALTQPRSKHHRKRSRHRRDPIAPSRVIGNLDEDLIDIRSQLDAESRQSLQRLPNACADLQGLELTTDKFLDRVTDSEVLAHSEKNESSGSPMDGLQRKSLSSKASSNGGMQQRQKGSPFLLHPLGHLQMYHRQTLDIHQIMLPYRFHRTSLDRGV